MLQHNRAYNRRHEEHAEELGLSSTYPQDFPSDPNKFPSHLSAWQGDVVEKLRKRRSKDGDLDFQFARKYATWEPWSLAEVDLSEFFDTVTSCSWKGPLRRLTALSVACFVDGYSEEARRGHDSILSLLDRGKNVEPIVLVHWQGQRLVHEGNHRTLTLCDWFLRNNGKRHVVPVYYRQKEARSLALPEDE